MEDLQLLGAKPREDIRHPVEEILRNAEYQQQQQELHRIRTAYGWAAAARHAMDQARLLGTRRPGSLHVSHALYHHYTGGHDDIDVSDIFGSPQNDPNVQPAPRALVEKQFYGEEVTMRRRAM